MIRKTPQELHDLLKLVLVAAGASTGHADAVAEHLVASELAGVETHGIRPFWLYIRDIADGELLPATEPKILEETDTSALISGNWTFGHVAAKYGMEVAIEKAKTSNVAIVSLVQLHHIGRVGHYGEMAAEAGMVGIITGSGYCRSEPRAAPHGGRATALDTNPISIGFPNPEEPDGRPVLLDYATTFRAHGALHLAVMRGQPTPPGFLIDKDGEPTTDSDALENGGAILPFGTYKGYALMVAVEYLGRIVSGSDSFIDPARGGDMFRHQGVTMIVFKADLFRSMQDYAQGALDTAQFIRDVPPARGYDAVRMPGDPEADARARYAREGIPIADDIWAMLAENAALVGVEIT